MARLSIYQVDAFSNEVFGGNPAAVVPLEEPLDDDTLQAIAAENNLSETAFITEAGQHFQLRWFTPTTEVPLCGHATLASAWVIFNDLWPDLDRVLFSTLSGDLSVVQADNGMLEMDLPRLAVFEEPNPPEALLSGFNVSPTAIFRVEGDSNYLALFDSEDSIRQIRVDLALFRTLENHGVIVTAPGKACDFVSRYFAPAMGIDEDPVTGSIHCALTPFWALRLGRDQFLARQLSARGGELHCRLAGERVIVAGHVTPYMKGEIWLDHDEPEL